MGISGCLMKHRNPEGLWVYQEQVSWNTGIQRVSGCTRRTQGRFRGSQWRFKGSHGLLGLYEVLIGGKPNRRLRSIAESFMGVLGGLKGFR